MSLKKSLTLRNGFSGEYWKIIEINLDRITPGSHVTLALFKDASFKDSPAGVLETRAFDWYGDNFPFTSAALATNNPVEIAYAKIITDDAFFADAETV